MERPNVHGEYDPLAKVDHVGICEDFFLSTYGEIQHHIHAEYDRQMELDRPVFGAFQGAVSRLRDAGNEGNYFDDEEKKAALEYGILLGLSLLEYMAKSLQVDTDEYFQQWADSSLTAVLINTDHERYGDRSQSQKADLLSNGIRILGLRHLEQLPDAYKDLIKKAEQHFPDIQAYNMPFQAGFGYVMGSGYLAMQYSFVRSTIGEIDFESLLDRGETDEGATITHQSMADKFVHLIEADDCMSVESFLEQVVQDNADSYEQISDTLQALTYALYCDESELGMDDTAAAFFMGTNLGIHIATDIGKSQLGEARFLERWLKEKLHRELSKYGPDYHERTRIDAKKAFEKLCNLSTLPQEYGYLLKLIDEEQEYDEEDSAAFRDGFRYSLVTLLGQVEAQKKSDASRTAKKEVGRFDEEFDVFIRENDLTGGLHEVYGAYLEHCKAFGVDPDNITEDAVSNILKLVLEDYDRLMPEIDQIEVLGPCFLIMSDGENEQSAVLLEKGSRLRGTIEGFRIAPAPMDMSYVDPAATEIGQFPLRYMPSFVLKGIQVVTSNGTEHDEETETLIGFVVPGATFRRVDF